MMPDEPLVGRWYWVRVRHSFEASEGVWWFPAKRDLTAAGGWTNEDCWADYDGNVQEWKPIPLPEDLPGAGDD